MNEELIQEHRGQGGDLGTDGRISFMDDLPGGLMAIVAVLAGDIEPEGVGGSFGEELLPRSERFHLIELILNQAVGRFHIGLPGTEPREGWGGGRGPGPLRPCG